MSGFIKDKPRDCQYCYYWSKKAPHCTYGSKCYYSKPEPAPKKPEGKCAGCPYGRDFPCIGWCTKDVLAFVKGGGIR